MFAFATSSRLGRRYSYYAVTFIAVAVVFLVAQWHRTSQGGIRSTDHSKWHMLERSQRYTRLVGGTDGFYTFDNVFVKNQVIRESYRVHHRLITFPSTFPCLNPDMASCPSWLAFRPEFPALETIITSHPNSPPSSTLEPFPYHKVAASLSGGRYPELPRLRVSTTDEAARDIPGWNDSEPVPSPNRWWRASTSPNMVEVLRGTTVSLRT
jgi:hypothetical protein